MYFEGKNIDCIRILAGYAVIDGVRVNANQFECFENQDNHIFHVYKNISIYVSRNSRGQGKFNEIINKDCLSVNIDNLSFSELPTTFK